MFLVGPLSIRPENNGLCLANVISFIYLCPMNSKTKGNISEAIILAHLLKSGHSISIPFGNNSRYDLILDDGAHLLRVQCKTATYKNGCVVFSIASVNGFNGKKTNYVGTIDLFIVYCPQLDSIYKIPIQEAPTKSSMVLRVDAPKLNTNTKSIKWASKYKI